MGRPSDYTPEKAIMICEKIAKGEALHIICEQDETLPDFRTVYRWLEKHGEFRQQYALAREMQQDFEADNNVVIADNATDANLARLQIDARKWRASKLFPKKYGDSTTIRGDKDNPIEFALAGKLDNAVNRLQGKIIDMIDVTKPKEDDLDVTNGSQDVT